MAAPTKNPRTTHKCRPKIEVRFQSWSVRKEEESALGIGVSLGGKV